MLTFCAQHDRSVAYKSVRFHRFFYYDFFYQKTKTSATLNTFQDQIRLFEFNSFVRFESAHSIQKLVFFANMQNLVWQSFSKIFRKMTSDFHTTSQPSQLVIFWKKKQKSGYKSAHIHFHYIRCNSTRLRFYDHPTDLRAHCIVVAHSQSAYHMTETVYNLHLPCSIQTYRSHWTISERIELLIYQAFPCMNHANPRLCKLFH